MDDRDRALLRRAVENARIAIGPARSGGPAWRDDLKTVDAVSRRIEEVGEALSKASREVRAATPTIAWKTAIGLRTHLAHDYINVDLDLVEATVEDDLPELIAAIEGVLGDQGS
jgi:uncharacterized protein with HEPN domain